MRMMEILFRGKRKDNGEWVYGHLVKHDERYYIYYEKPDEMCQTGNWLCHKEVLPETVGQCTGLQDKNYEWIFKGDIVKVRQDRNDGIGIIGYEHGSFVVYVMSGDIYERTLFEYWYNDWDLELIGNKHDDSDLKPKSRILQKGWRCE